MRHLFLVSCNQHDESNIRSVSRKLGAGFVSCWDIEKENSQDKEPVQEIRSKQGLTDMMIEGMNARQKAVEEAAQKLNEGNNVVIIAGTGINVTGGDREKMELGSPDITRLDFECTRKLKGEIQRTLKAKNPRKNLGEHLAKIAQGLTKKSVGIRWGI